MCHTSSRLFTIRCAPSMQGASVLDAGCPEAVHRQAAGRKPTPARPILDVPDADRETDVVAPERERGAANDCLGGPGSLGGGTVEPRDVPDVRAAAVVALPPRGVRQRRELNLESVADIVHDDVQVGGPIVPEHLLDPGAVSLPGQPRRQGALIPQMLVRAARGSFPADERALCVTVMAEVRPDLVSGMDYEVPTAAAGLGRTPECAAVVPLEPACVEAVLGQRDRLRAC
jgi:hypothetical protein